MNEISKNPTVIDEIEFQMLGMERIQCEVAHHFAGGIYRRSCFIPAGSMLTTMLHKTEHFFMISQGKVDVISETEGTVTYEAPFHGITKPGTRRAIFAHSDTIWTTYHATELTDVEAIAAEILEPHTNPYAPDIMAQWDRNLPQ